MRNFKYGKSKQRGLAGVVFLIIALLAMVMGAIAYMSRGSNTGLTSEGAKTNASVILKQASDFKDGFDRFLVSGSVTASQITFDATPGTGLFDPTAGYAILQLPPAAAVVSGTPAYTYNNNVQLNNIGTAAPDVVLSLGNVSLAVCQQINKIMYNDDVLATPPQSTGSLAQWTTSPSAVSDGGVAGMLNRSEGCVTAAGGSQYVYYKTLAEN